MKAFISIATVSTLMLAVSSCEKHQFENEVKIVKEPIYDAETKPVMVKDKAGNMVQDFEETEVVTASGSKSFFYDEYGEKKVKEQQLGEKSDH